MIPKPSANDVPAEQPLNQSKQPKRPTSLGGAQTAASDMLRRKRRRMRMLTALRTATKSKRR